MREKDPVSKAISLKWLLCYAGFFAFIKTLKKIWKSLAEAEKIMPDYKNKRDWLKENGEDIISRTVLYDRK